MRDNQRDNRQRECRRSADVESKFDGKENMLSLGAYPAGTDENNPPAPPRVEPYKTHLAYVKERRSDTDGAAILEEALNRIRR